MSGSILPTDLWTHVKSGHRYQILHIGTDESDLAPMVIYRLVQGTSTQPYYDGVWIRPAAEFFDGRFLPYPLHLREA